MLPELTERLRDRWAEMDLCPRPTRIDYLNIAGSVEGGTTTFLGFAPGQDQPLLAVKVQRRRGPSSRLETERDVLGTIALAGPRYQRAVPRVLFCDGVANHAVLVTTIVPGTTLPLHRAADGVDLEGARPALESAARWMGDLTVVTRSRAAADRHAALERLESVAGAFRTWFPLTAAEADGVTTALAAAREVVGGGPVLHHGDFTRHNILLDPGPGDPAGVHVIDWTFASRVGTPLQDVWFLGVTYALQLREEPGLQGFVRSFQRLWCDPASAYQQWYRALLHELGRGLDVSSEVLAPLEHWFLIERAVFEAALVREAAASGQWSRHTLALAAEAGVDRAASAQQQFWIHLYRSCFAHDVARAS